MSTAMREEFVHPALLYRDDEEYLAGTVPFIRDGLAAGEPVAVAVPGPNLELIRDALGADAQRVLLRDMAEAGRNPGRIIPTVLLAFANAHRRPAGADHRRADLGRPQRHRVPGLRPARGADQRRVHRPAGHHPVPVQHRTASTRRGSTTRTGPTRS